MKIFLYILGIIAFNAPILLWGWMVEMGCGYNTSGSSCGVKVGDYFNLEFLNIALIPWCFAAVCIYYAQRAGSKTESKDVNG